MVFDAMVPPPVPPNEASRAAAVDAIGVVDRAPDPSFDDLVAMAACICRTPIAIISFVTSDKQIIKARVGLNYSSTPREIAFCAHTVGQGTNEPFVVPDALKDDRFHDNPNVLGDPHIRFYAGMPVMDAKGHAIGTICVIDRVPRELAPEQLKMLRMLAKHVLIHLEIRQPDVTTKMDSIPSLRQGG